MKLLKFYTNSYCQCKMLSKAFEDFNLVPIEPIDCEEDPDDLVTKFQVRSLPTLVLVDNNGEFLRKFTGHITKEEVEGIVRSELRQWMSSQE